MRMFVMMLTAAVFFLMARTTNAAEDSLKRDVEIALSQGIWSSYTFDQNVRIPETTFWGDVTFSWEKWSAGVWWQVPFSSDPGTTPATEIDLTLTRFGKTNLGSRDVFYRVKLEYFWLFPRSADVDIFNVEAWFAIDVHRGWLVSAEVDRNTVLGDPASGWVVKVGVSHAYCRGAWSVNVGGYGVYDSGVFGSEDGWNLKGELGLTYEFFSRGASAGLNLEFFGGGLEGERGEERARIGFWGTVSF